MRRVWPPFSIEQLHHSRCRGVFIGKLTEATRRNLLGTESSSTLDALRCRAMTRGTARHRSQCERTVT